MADPEIPANRLQQFLDEDGDLSGFGAKPDWQKVYLNFAASVHEDTAKQRQAICAAVVPLLRLLAGGTCCEMAESFLAEVTTATGFMGGDAGHGGALKIKFSVDCGSNGFVVIPGFNGELDGELDAEDRSYQSGSVELAAFGDWEQSGLVGALANLLAKLLPLYTPKG